MFNKKLKQRIGAVVVFSQLFSALTPILTFAAPQQVSGGDIQNSLESVGTKANRLKTIGSSGVDESTGAFTYSYPFALPKGLNGLEPSIGFSYNSQASENSIVGFGWNMAIPYIERTARYGVDRIYTKNDFVSSLGGELTQKSGTTNQYLQKIDDGSYQLYTINNDIWTLTDRSGNTYTYGTTLDSRLCDSTCKKIQKYYITEVKDVFGNKIKYFYEKKNNFVYPKEIVYTVKKDGTYSNKISFERETRLDNEVSYKSGFRTELSDRIKAIHVYTDNVEVAKLELLYVVGQNGTRSLLSTIRESRLGTDNVWITLPDTLLTYEKGADFTPTQTFTEVSNGYTRIDTSGDSAPETVSLTDGTPGGMSWTFLDYDGDYLTDKYFNVQGGSCYGNCTPTSDYKVIKKNSGLSSFIDISAGTVNLPYTGGYNNYSQAIQNDVPAVDVNADGLQDIIDSTIRLNFGGTFVNATYTLPNYSVKSFIDFNGDGLADVIKDYASTTATSTNGKYVFLNNGNGWNTTPELNFKVEYTPTVRMSAVTSEFDSGTRFQDVNGDGLVDIIRAYTSTQSESWLYNQGNIAPTGNVKELYINTGNSFVKVNNPSIPGNFVNYYQAYNGASQFQGSVLEEGTNPTKRDVLKSVTSPLGSKTDVTYKGSASQNNPKLPINILTVSEIKNTEVNKNIVETTKYTYENGKMYFDKFNVYDRRFAGFGKVTTEKGSTRVVKYFHQGDGDDATTYERGDSFHNIGKAYKEETYGITGGVATKYGEAYRTYGVYNWDGQVYKYPKLEVSTEYDASGNSFSKAVQYDYDLAARLPKQTENFGEVKWDITTGTISDVGDDYVLTKNIYNTKRPQKLLAEESSDVNGKFLDKKLYFYDELPFGYVEKGLLSEERNYSTANSYIKTTYTYNDQGLVATKTDPNGAVTTFTYDANYNPATVTNALNQTTTSVYNKVLGVATSVTDPNGKVVQTIYDGFGNVKSISATSPADGTLKLTATKNISYSGAGMIETENIHTPGGVYRTTQKYYDSFGRLIKSQNTNTDNSNQTIDVTYNNLGQMITVSYPYDSNGFLSEYFAGNDTKYAYDSIGRNITVTQGDLINYTDYILNGKITRDNSSDQHKKEYRYNSLGKLSSVTEYNGTTPQTTKYEWNLLGNLTKITDPLNNVRNFFYDSEGRLLKQEDLHSPTDNTFGTYTYTYDVNGLLTSKQDPSGNVATYEYDILNRPKKESFGNVTTYTYDTCANGVGALCTVANSDYTQNLTYNKTGNVVTETKVIPSATSSKTFTNTYIYNDLGQNTSITLPDNSVISYTYDVNGKQKTASLTRTINGQASTTQVVTDSKYNIDGTVKSITHGNNLKSCYEYSDGSTGSPQAGGNVLPRLSSIKVGNNDCVNNLLFQQDLKYNLFGSITENKETIGANNFNSGVSQNFTNKYIYDTLQRLTKSERFVGTSTSSTVNNISYNQIGNILSSDSTNYSYNGTDYQNPHAPSVIGSTQMQYDLNGNILTDGKNVYEWTMKNTLEKVKNSKSTTLYTYDINRERIKEVANVKSANSTSTFAVINESLIGTALIQGLVVQLPLITESSFNELKINKLNSQNKVEMLFALALESNKYVKDVCKLPANVSDVNCQKKESIKFVAQYLNTKHNIKLSSQTLEEMYQVYLGSLKLSNSADNYDRANNLYKNQVTATPTLSVSTTSLATLVYGDFANQDKTLLGYTYKQKKIASLFGSNKLVSKETFQEVSSLSFTYSDLIIKDMLIDASFAPYSTCDQYAVDEVERKCRKEIFVKYLFAILKYETDRELGPEALDELYEITEGNLMMPNNINDYYIRDTKNYSGTDSNYSTLRQYWNNGMQPDTAPALGPCEIGTYYNGVTHYRTCSFTLTLPQEVKDRYKEIETTYINNLVINQGNSSYSAGVAVLQPYSVPNLIVSTSDNQFTSPNTTAIVTQSTVIDISAITKALTNNVPVNNVLTLNTTGTVNDHSVVSNAGQLILSVNYIKDATQNLRTYFTPLVINPKDSAVYANVLQVLARIDKDYKTTQNQIVSSATYEEIKNSDATNTEKLVKLFDENEKLQKDDTLSAVWNAHKVKYNQDLSREALEEMYMVWKGQLSLPVEAEQYNWAIATSTRQYFNQTNWEFFTENSSGGHTIQTCNPSNSYIFCFFKVTPNNKPYTKITSANLTFSGATFGYGSTINIVPLVEYPASGTINLANTSNLQPLTIPMTSAGSILSANLSQVYKNYQDSTWKNNGFRIQVNYSMALPDLTLATTDKHYIDYNVDPTFQVFDRNTLTNLSVVPGVFSTRTLADFDIINTKMYVATSSKDELKTAGIEKKADILQFTTTISGFTSTSTIKRENKVDNLTKINSEILRIKNINLSREALEEIYYIWNGKLIISNLDLPANAPQEISGLLTKYKMNGGVNTAVKKQDEQRPDKPIFVESAIASTNGQGDTTGLGAYQFNTGYVKFPNTVPVITNNAQTYSIWYKGTGGQALWSTTAKGSRNFISTWFNGTKLQVELGWAGSSNYYVNTTNVVADNAWHKVDVVLENNPNVNIKVYVDGVLDVNSQSVGVGNNSPYALQNISNEFVIGAVENWYSGNMQTGMNGEVDEFKIYNKALTPAEIQTAYNNDIGNYSVVLENLDVFQRSNFKLLEPIAGVTSQYEKSQTDNITYDITSSDVKNISADTVGELKLAGVTTKQQILDVFALTKTVDKDSQLSFFKEYFEVKNYYTFSRDALEEIYLVYLGKATYISDLTQTTIVNQDTYSPTNTNWSMTNNPSGAVNPINCEAGVTSTGSSNSYTQSNSSCTFILKVPKKDGYKVKKANLTYAFANSNIDAYINNVLASENGSSGNLNVTGGLDTNNQVTVKITGKYLPYFTTYLNPITNLKVTATYEMLNATQDRDTYGELSNVSTEKKIDTSYTNEINSTTFNTGTTSTTTIVRVTSPVAFAEMTAIGATTSAQVKAHFNSASSTLGKDAKLYFVWKTIKDTKNVELTRLTLEEMWNINIDRQVATLGQLSTTTVTTTTPTPLASLSYYKMDGALGTNAKKQDEVLTTRQATENGATSAPDRNSIADKAYQFTRVGMNKMVFTNPVTLTNNAITFSVWVKALDGGSNYQRIISTNTDSTRTFIDLDIYQNKPYLEIGNEGFVNREGWGVASLANGSWHKLDYTLQNSPNATLKLYVDGNLDTTLVATAPYNFSNRLPNTVNLGCYGTGANCVSPYQGSVDNFKIYDRALTDAEVLREYQLDTNSLPPVVSTTTIVSADVFNRDRYKELEYISPISTLKYAYDVQTGAIIEPPVDESIKNPPQTNTNTTPLATLDNPSTSSGQATYTISTTTLALLNPLNYSYSVTSPTSIDLQIGGVTYNVSLQNYAEFYTNLANNTIDTLAKYINKINNASDEVEYTKYYPSSYYEYDSRGYITINIPFNGKVVATVKYKEDGSLTETSYPVNNYLATPVLITALDGTVTEVIKRDAWGNINSNDYDSNNVIPTSYGFTGHRQDYDSNLTYAHSRYLSNSNRVWLSEDPVQFDSFNKQFFLMNPQTQNGYSYANNDPVNRIDPDGRLSVKSSWEWLKQTASCFCSTATVTNNNQNNNTLLTSGNKFNVLDFNKQMVNAKPTINGTVRDARVSSNGAEFVKKHEGLVLNRYGDTGGLPTIGYGHWIKPGENYPDKIDKSYADNILNQDINDATRKIDIFIDAQLNQNQFDALTSFVFNVGLSNKKTKDMINMVNSGDYNPEYVTKVFMYYVHDSKGNFQQGLSSRREDEINLFLNGEY